MNVFSKGKHFRGPLLLGAAIALCAPARAATTNGLGSFTGSLGCRDCHERFYQLWNTSHHGLAMQPYSAGLAKSKLTPQTNGVVAGPYRFRADIENGTVTERKPDGEATYRIDHVMGGKNVYYFLTPLERGWLQVLPVAYDVRRKEWYDTTASAMRHFGDRRDEALYWKERPLTFNTSCYNCHVSQLSRNYDLKTDSYHTTWVEPGINCETCHNSGAEHVQLFRQLPKDAPSPADPKIVVTRKLSTAQRNDLCAPCHAKMSPVTSSFAPGDRYFDHFDLTAFDDSDFYPDGRDLGENYTFTQWRLSPCAKSGQLDCLHCHTSSGRYRFTDNATANNACLPCHSDKVNDAPAHTHHKADGSGNRCVSCHMPTTEFARMRRSDHSMRPPAPAASALYGSPNACNLCHTDKNAAWADRLVRQWRTRDYQAPILQQAALIDAARKVDWKKLPDILAYLSRTQREEVHTVSLVRLLRSCPDERKWPVLRKLLDDPSPWVRSVAAESLGDQLDPPNVQALGRAVGDGYRLVRVRAAGALAGLPEQLLTEADGRKLRAATAELLDSMTARPDDMASHYNLGNLHMARGQMQEAVGSFETALRLRPDAIPPLVNASLAYNALGQNARAEASLRRALSMDPTNAVVNLNLGMLLAEMNKTNDAERAFRTAVASDPQSAQAAYNLGVLLAKDKPAEALEWCRKASALRPQESRYAYTLAFFQQQQGKADDAIQTLENSIAQSPPHTECYALLGQLYEQRKQPARAIAVYRKAADNEKLPGPARAEFLARARGLSGGQQ